jgi:hypothetical protein
MLVLKRMLAALRHFLTAQRPTQSLVIVLIGSWIWLGIAVEMPFGSFLLVTLVVVVFVLTKYGSAIEDHRAATRRRNSSRKNDGRDKRDFLRQFPLIVALPIVVSFYVSLWTGVKATGLVVALTIVYVLLAPGEVFPKHWRRKLRRRVQRSLGTK